MYKTENLIIINHLLLLIIREAVANSCRGKLELCFLQSKHLNEPTQRMLWVTVGRRVDWLIHCFLSRSSLIFSFERVYVVLCK